MGCGVAGVDIDVDFDIALAAADLSLGYICRCEYLHDRVAYWGSGIAGTCVAALVVAWEFVVGPGIHSRHQIQSSLLQGSLPCFPK